MFSLASGDLHLVTAHLGCGPALPQPQNGASFLLPPPGFFHPCVEASELQAGHSAGWPFCSQFYVLCVCLCMVVCSCDVGVCIWCVCVCVYAGVCSCDGGVYVHVVYVYIGGYECAFVCVCVWVCVLVIACACLCVLCSPPQSGSPRLLLAPVVPVGETEAGGAQPHAPSVLPAVWPPAP